MPKKWLSYLMMSLLLLASVALGCRAPYPTYNPYGFYGQPCVNPPPTGAYPTGRTDPYYGAPANGVYPPNPYAPPQYPGYPPVQQPAGSTSKRTWNPQTSNDNGSPTVEPQKLGPNSVVTSTDGAWKSIDNPNNVGRDDGVRTASLDTGSSFSSGSSGAPQNDIARFDGFGRN